MKRRAELSSSFAPSTRCDHCRRRLAVRFDTADGKLVDVVEFCGCPTSRRLAGVCQDCIKAVDGMPGRALRCARHKLEQRRQSWRKHHHRHKDKRNARCREYSKRTSALARKRERSRRWRQQNPEKVRAGKKRYAFRHPDRILDQYERHSNANRPDRAQMKRDWAREHQQVYHGRSPACADCGVALPWSRRGRPPKRCDSCNPTAVRARESKRAARRPA